MSKRKLQRQRRQVTNKQDAPVLIVRPYNPEGLTCEQTSSFEKFNFGNRIADLAPRKSKVPESARNKSIQEFLDPKGKYQSKTHIFFLDDDSPPLEDDAIVKLLSHRKSVVCAPTPILRYDYALQSINMYWNTMGMEPGHTEEAPKFSVYEGAVLPKRLFRCYRTGGTGLLIRRDVLEKLPQPYQKTTYTDDWTDATLSEDMYFCDQIRKAGFDIWADGLTVCRHFHRLDILDILAMRMGIQLDKDREDDPILQRILQQKLKDMVPKQRGKQSK